MTGGDSSEGAEALTAAADWPAVAALRPEVLRFVRRMTYGHADAEDLTQQALLNAMRSLGNFRGGSSLATWVKGVAFNTVRQAQRAVRRRREDALDEDHFERADPQDPGPDRRLESRSEVVAVERALRELPEGFQEVVIAVCLEEMSYEEAADCLGIAVGTVRSRLSRARQMLAERLGREGR